MTLIPAERTQTPGINLCPSVSICGSVSDSAATWARRCRKRHAASPRVSSCQLAGSSGRTSGRWSGSSALLTVSVLLRQRRPYGFWPGPWGRSHGLPTCPRAPGPPSHKPKHKRKPSPKHQRNLGLLKKPPLVILSPSLPSVILRSYRRIFGRSRVNSAKNHRDDDSTRVRRPFTSFRVT